MCFSIFDPVPSYEEELFMYSQDKVKVLSATYGEERC